jgi:hypothetical protein
MLQLSEQGVYAVDIYGLAAGEHSYVDVLGMASLGGSIIITLRSSFTKLSFSPGAERTIELIRYSKRTGDFASIRITAEDPAANEVAAQACIRQTPSNVFLDFDCQATIPSEEAQTIPDAPASMEDAVSPAFWIAAAASAVVVVALLTFAAVVIHRKYPSFSARLLCASPSPPIAELQLSTTPSRQSVSIEVTREAAQSPTTTE